MIAAILCNGTIRDYEYCKQLLIKADTIICADGGTGHAYKMGIIPDVIIGDLDSAKEEYIAHFKTLNVPINKYKAQKDETDTEICLLYAMEKHDEIWLLGATGSRLDHTLANISIMSAAVDRGIKACMIDENHEIYVIKDSIELTGQKGDIISLLPLSGKVEGITIRGVGYPLTDAVMEIGHPYGVSNVFEENTVQLSIKTGYMIVMKTKE